MPASNADIAAMFEEIADLLEVEGENPFRVRAYRNAARELNSLGVSVADIVARGEALDELPGIGADLARKITEVVTTGELRALTELRARTPGAVVALLDIPGLGPKRVHKLYHELKVETPEQLVAAARAGSIQALRGFGAKIEQAILEAVAGHASKRQRFPLAEARRAAEPLKHYLEKTPGVHRVVIAGSYRRQQPDVGDLDFLVTTDDARAVMDRFVNYDKVAKALARGETRASVELHSGMQVDLRVVDDACFGAALQYFTGPKAHNIALRRRAQQQDLKINEYGVFRGKRRIAGETEESVYEAVGMRWLPPSHREHDVQPPTPKKPAG